MGTATMRIHWDVMHKAEGSHFGWAVISTNHSEEIIALYECMYVIISCSSGALWIRYCAGIWMRPVEAWWTGVPDTGLLKELDYATSGITECNRLIFTPNLAPRDQSGFSGWFTHLLRWQRDDDA